MNTIRSRIALLLGLVLVVGCGPPSLEQARDEARAALGSHAYADVLQRCDEALKRCESEGAGKALVWQMESLRAEALAHLGRAEDVVQTLARLAGDFAAQITPALYVKLTSAVQSAGDLVGAITLIDAGKKRFHDQADKFDAVIAQLKKAAQEGGDSEATARLKSLGYL